MSGERGTPDRGRWPDGARADEDDQALPPELRAAVGELGARAPVPPPWRAARLRALDEEAPSARPPARWSVRPPAAIAAALACAVLGAAGAWSALRGGARAGDGPAAPAALGTGGGARVVVPFALVAPGASRVALV